MKLAFTLPVLFSVILLSSFYAFAEGPASCMNEVKKLCPDQKLGGKMAKCAQKNQAEFSAPCQEKIKELKELVKSAMKVCRADIHQACNGVKSGGGRIVECVLAHQSEFSAPCRAKITEGFAILGESP